MLSLCVVFFSVLCPFSSATLTAPIERFMDEGDKQCNPAWRTCNIKFQPDEERCPCEVIRDISEGLGTELSDCGYGKHQALESPVSERCPPCPKCPAPGACRAQCPDPCPSCPAPERCAPCPNCPAPAACQAQCPDPCPNCPAPKRCAPCPKYPVPTAQQAQCPDPCPSFPAPERCPPCPQCPVPGACQAQCPNPCPSCPAPKRCAPCPKCPMPTARQAHCPVPCPGCPVPERCSPCPYELFSSNISIGEGVNTVLIILWMVVDFVIRRFGQPEQRLVA